MPTPADILESVTNRLEQTIPAVRGAERQIRENTIPAMRDSSVALLDKIGVMTIVRNADWNSLRNSAAAATHQGASMGFNFLLRLYAGTRELFNRGEGFFKSLSKRD